MGRYIFRFITKRVLVIFFHGYKGNKNELPFLRKYIVKNLKLSFFSFTYGQRTKNNEIRNIKNLGQEIQKIIDPIIKEGDFKKVIFIGYSLGGAIALKTVINSIIQCDGLVFLSLFDRRKSLLHEKRVLLNQNEDIAPVNLIKKIPKTIPVVLIHGQNDKSISSKRSYRVFQKRRSLNTSFIAIPVGHHFTTKTDQDIIKKTFKFVIKTLLIKSNLKTYTSRT